MGGDVVGGGAVSDNVVGGNAGGGDVVTHTPTLLQLCIIDDVDLLLKTKNTEVLVLVQSVGYSRASRSDLFFLADL